MGSFGFPLCLFLLFDEGQRVAGLPTATSTADTMDIVFVGLWDIEIDDMGHIIDIEAARSDIGCDEHLEGILLEPAERSLALALRLVAMDRV